MRRLTLLLLAIAISSSYARTPSPTRKRASVPLMPSPQAVPATPSEHTLLPPQEEVPYTGRRTHLGFGFGILGKSQATNSSLIGLNSFVGLRGFGSIPVREKWRLVPSIGFMYRSEGSGSLTVSEYRFEAGLSGLYELLERERWQLSIGLAQRLDLYLSRISIYQAGTNSNPALLYRLGPSAHFDFKINPQLNWYVETEATVSFASSVRIWPAVFTGIQIPIGN